MLSNSIKLIITIGALVVFNQAAYAVSEVDAYIEEAQAYMEKGEWKAAALQLRNALQQDSNNAYARFILGKAYLNLGLAADAERELKQANQLGIQGGEWRFLLAKAYLQQGNQQEVMNIVVLDPNDTADIRASLLAIRGLAELNLKKLDTARQDFDTALTLSPDNVDALLGVAKLAVMEKNYTDAAQWVNRAVATNPTSIEALNSKGALAALQQNWPESIAAYDHALELQPDDHVARLGRARTLLEQQETDKALADIEKVKKVAPKLPQVNFLQALAQYQKQDMEGALESLDRVLREAPDYIDSFFLLGQIHYAQGQLEQADHFLNRYVADRPDFLPARKLLAEVKLKLNNPAQAIEVLEPAREQAATDKEFLALLGVAYLTNLDYKQGTNYLQKALEIDPKNKALRAQLALSYLALNQTDKAALELANSGLERKEIVELLEQTWKKNPNDLTTGLLLIQQYLMNRKNAEALTIAQRLHTVYPEKPATLYALSLAQLATGNAKAAVTGLRSVVEQTPGAPPEGWYLLATAQLAAGDQDAARATLDKVLSLQNDYLPALTTKAQLLVRNQQYDQALKEIKTIQSRYADQSIGYRLEGDLYRQQGDFPKASRAYQAAYERAADSSLVLALAGTLHQQGKQEEVIATLRRWLAAHPKDLTVRTELADYLVRRQRLPEAMTEYEAIIEQSPDNAMILNNLAVLYQKKGDNRALQYAERAAALAPAQPNFADTLGWILVQNNQVKRGLELLQKALAQKSDSPDIRYHLAAALAKMGRTEEARKELSQVVGSGKRFDELEEAKALLGSLKR